MKNIDNLDKVREKVDAFLNPLGYSAKVEKSIGDVLYIIEPSTRKVGNKRSDYFDGMQILAMDNGTFEVSEYQAGENENELYIYKETNSLTNALKDLIKGNKRKPIKKYKNGGGVGEHIVNGYGTLKNGTKVYIGVGSQKYPNGDGVGVEGIYYNVKYQDGKEKLVNMDEIAFPIKDKMKNGGATERFEYSIGGL